MEEINAEDIIVRGDGIVYFYKGDSNEYTIEVYKRLLSKVEVPNLEKLCVDISKVENKGLILEFNLTSFNTVGFLKNGQLVKFLTPPDISLNNIWDGFFNFLSPGSKNNPFNIRSHPPRDKFKKANYGSKEYQECIDAVKPAVDHHYANNRHHTSFHGGTIDGMNLVDIIEMVCDWKAAVRRSPDKNLEDTLEYSFDKYGIGDQMQKIIVTTLEDLGWIEPQHQARC